MSDEQTEETNRQTPPTPEEACAEPLEKPKKPPNMKPGAVKLRSWLNKSLRIKMSDGRVLIGVFLCTDRDANVILGSCSEFLPENEEGTSAAAAVAATGGSKANEEPRMLGLVMVPGKHIVSVAVDRMEHHRGCAGRDETVLATPLPEEVRDEDVT